MFYAEVAVNDSPVLLSFCASQYYCTPNRLQKWQWWHKAITV